MIITRYTHLVQAYDDLGPGDIFIGRIPASHQRAALMTDLTARGVVLLPSAAAQMISTSKTTQAFIFKRWMLPQTRVIARRKDLLDAIEAYTQKDITAAVTKQDHLHCGHGVRRWNDLETMYNCLSMAGSHYPFVLQPFVPVSADVRVIIVEDYCEAYARQNPHGFRMNLAIGGSSHPQPLTAPQMTLCQKVMARARMPYAHIDLIVTADGESYFSEINLNGGTAGARIARSDLDRMKQEQLMRLADAMDH